MKRKFKVTLVVFLVVVLGCFSQVFAATNQSNRSKKIAEVKKSVQLLSNAIDDGGVVGTSNLNGTTENSAKIGDKLTSPEIGWKRYDDTNSLIKYIGNWKTEVTSIAYNGSHPYSETRGDEILIKGYFSKLRIIDCKYFNRTDADHMEVFKDGISIGKINTYSTTGGSQLLMFERSFSDNSYKEIEIKNISTDGKYADIDAIDIDSTGYLIDSSATLATGISLNKTTDSVVTGQTDTLTATITPDNTTNKAITWTTSDSSIATVDSTGNVTAVKEGTATITATTTDGSNLSSSCTITVTKPTTISLNKASDLIEVGKSDTLTAEINPNNIGVAWTSSDTSVVTVDANGKITGIKAGIATIIATTADGKTTSCAVTVKDQEIGKSKLIIYMGNQFTREYYLTEDEINDFINWYDARANDQTPKSYYVFNVPAQGALPAKRDYVLFNKIKAFEVE